MTVNFDVELTWEYGWKHFFGFQDDKLSNSDDTLFICIVRNPVDWINSFFREKWHLPLKYKKGIKSVEKKINIFLNDEFWSFDDANGNRDTTKEIMEDRNIYTGERYKNIFELRHTKIKWMLEDLPKKVKNYIFITHEELLKDFNKTILRIKEKGLQVKSNDFPINITNYKGSKKRKYVKKENIISPEIILKNPKLIQLYEKQLNYI